MLRPEKRRAVRAHRDPEGAGGPAAAAIDAIAALAGAGRHADAVGRATAALDAGGASPADRMTLLGQRL